MRCRMIFAALTFFVCCTAHAAKGANFSAIGYSADSRYFAFEQYGIQDGSGFPFWDIFVMNLETNTMVGGGVLYVVIDDETGKLSAARNTARELAEPLLKKYAITEPATLIAANPSTEIVVDRHRIAFDRWYRPMGATPESEATADIRHEILVEAVKLTDHKGCIDADGTYFGFSLTLKDLKLNSSHEFYKDTAIPDSRGCPIAYDMAAIVAPGGVPDEDRMVAIVGVYARGFEGADQRFVAVPFVLSD
jgi:predicted secreted protein